MATDAVSGEPGEMTLVEHLDELRWRILKSAAAVAIGFTLCFTFNQVILGWLLQPALHSAGLSSGQLVFTSPAEYFVAALKVSVFGGIYLALPVLLYQLVAFVSPGLTETERRLAVPMTAAAALLFTLGGAFSYWGLLPICLRFLVGFAPTTIVHPMLTV
ncbi:MAG: twin-arginine translocase subunit TatC, partial [Cyanobacteria bacterium REEB65]|nr:twin-arginine translocase subunit TatC [Cyanobacteria bacterium REEB65]